MAFSQYMHSLVFVSDFSFIVGQTIFAILSENRDVLEENIFNPIIIELGRICKASSRAVCNTHENPPRG